MLVCDARGAPSDLFSGHAARGSWPSRVTSTVLRPLRPSLIRRGRRLGAARVRHLIVVGLKVVRIRCVARRLHINRILQAVDRGAPEGGDDDEHEDGESLDEDDDEEYQCSGGYGSQDVTLKQQDEDADFSRGEDIS